MADEVDAANEVAALHLDIALRNYKQSPIMEASVATPQGFCLHCGADIPHPRRWCNASCRDQWQDHHR